MPKFSLAHPPHYEQAGKFAAGLAVLAGYFAYLWWKFDAKTGLILAGLTWSFFVLCTPIADAGFLLDFPIRLIFKIRMLVTEILVWVLAIIISGATLLWAPDVFEKSVITAIFHKILVTPVPYWGLIAICCVGTFMSVHLGDEMLDVIAHRDRDIFHRHGFWLRLVSFIAILSTAIIGYNHLMGEFGLNIGLSNG